MAMTMPRLSSGLYFSLLADSTANERHHVPEYPIFPVTHQPRKINQVRSTAEHRSRAMVDQSLHHLPPQTPQPKLCLPLLSVSISMQVDGNIAKTKVVQTFTNHGEISIPEAFYSFPLYDGATVTAFRCEVGDDKVLEGKVKPKDEAKREFQRAVQKQEVAALGEEMAPDVFQTTIGNIKPRTTIKVEIIYVEELLTDLSGDGIVVTIPTSVAPRYGTPPAGYATNSAVKETGLSLVVSLSSPGPMKSVVCRSGHQISVEYGKMSHVPEATSFEALAELQNPADSGLNPNHATVRLSIDETAMDRDIVLFVHSPDEVLLKSRALLAPSIGSDHAAMMVTVRPSELFSDLRESMDEFEGEIFFLADRSGSMRGSEIEELKDALLLFLKSLPAKCKFNLYSFGDYVSSLWPHSMPYNESTMQEALDHASEFEANFGGTQLLQALRQAVDDSRSTDVPSTQIILLTDGEVWQSEKTIEFVRLTTSESDSRVRFFSLGMGNQVSHQLIQGIGFFGGGFGEVVAVDANGEWNEAVIRILKGAMMPTSWSYSITFGDQWQETRLDAVGFLPQGSKNKASGAFNRIAEAVSHSFVQAPRTIPWLHHFGQQSIYFLFDTTSDKLPDHAVITACCQYGATKTVTLAVTKSAFNNNTIQHLAAKAIMRDLENQGTSETLSSNQIRKNAEDLCQMYSISSKWTSFVAVSHLQQSTAYEDIEVSLYKAPLTELDLLRSPAVPQTRVTSCCQYASLPRRLEGSVSDTKFLRGLPGPKGGVFRTLSVKMFRKDEGWTRSSGSDSRDLSCTTDVHGVPLMSLDEPGGGQCAITWQEIVRGQRADGLFHLEKSLRHSIAQHFCPATRQTLTRWMLERMKRPVVDDGEEIEMAGLLVDTVMVLAYIRSHLYSHRALWDLLVQKAEGKLALLLIPGEWARPNGLSAMADSALAHAHCGSYSQRGDEGSSRKDSLVSGPCGVCDSQGEESTLSANPNEGSKKCPTSGCDVDVAEWGVLWAHVVETGHIYSSCEAARNRWRLSEAQTNEPKAGGTGRILKVISLMKFKMMHKAKQDKKVKTNHRLSKG